MSSRGSRLLAEPAFFAGVAAYLVFTYWAAHGTLYVQGLVLVAAVFGMLAVSLDMVAGMTGLYSLGHAGLFALGSYATTILYNDHHWSLWLILPTCIVGVGLVGLALGALSLRVSGLYFAITTFIFTLVLTVVASDSTFTGGYGGLIGPLYPDFPSWLSWAGKPVIWTCLAALGITILITLGIRRSPLYPVLLAIRDAEPFAAAAGARTSAIKVGMFGLSAAIAGAAGWIFAFQGIVSPGQFNWAVSVNILVMVIIGGMNTTIGPVLGAAFITIFPAQVNINPFWQEVLFGTLFVAVIVLFPEGFMGVLRWAGRQVLQRLRTAPATARPPAAAGVEAHVPLATAAVEAAARAGDEAEAPVAAAADGELAITCRDVVFRYTAGPAVLSNVDFSVRAGTIHGLIGPNGSGKSTLVDLISGRIRPESGTIAIHGVAMERSGAATRARHGLARTFQSAALVGELAARQNVMIGLYTRIPRLVERSPLWPALPATRRETRKAKAAVAEALTLVGAEAWANARVADVPHGIEQLTQLAAAT
ncbi:MAG TPA: ATP-binding cassette domain-containing protein, partial [Gaiellales bacterium]